MLSWIHASGSINGRSGMKLVDDANLEMRRL